MSADRSESEFYYLEEEILNQMTPINLLPNFKKKKYKKKIINGPWSWVRPSAFGPDSRPRAQFFSHTDRPPAR